MPKGYETCGQNRSHGLETGENNIMFLHGLLTMQGL
jgi:hypothetical protein